MKPFNKNSAVVGGYENRAVGLVIVCIILAILFMYYFTIYGISNQSACAVNGKFYMVHNAHDNQAEAAKQMAEIDRRIEKLLRAPEFAPKYPEIIASYSFTKLIENSPKNRENTTSYVDADHMALCLRSEFGDIEDINTLMFVALHEISHYVTIKDDDDHGREFWLIFRDILLAAKTEGIIDLINYRDKPIRYCGLLIDYNPAL
jgi:hypothetical protein